MTQSGGVELAPLEPAEADLVELEPVERTPLPVVSGLVVLGGENAEQCADGACW